MRTPFTSSRAMALTLALDARDDAFSRPPYRAGRRVRRTRGASPDDRRG
jgi:hypothetical protein